MKYLVLIVISLTVSIVKAQQLTLVKQWDQRYGGKDTEVLRDFILTKDGGLFLGGDSHSNISGDKSQPNWDPSLETEDYWVIKIDSIGNKQWDRRLGTPYPEVLFSVNQTSDGGFIAGGIAAGFASGDKSQDGQGNWDYWIIKLDAQGNKEWDKRFGGIGWDGLSVVKQTSDGGYILGGTSDSPVSGDKTEPQRSSSGDYWLVKINSMGLKEWDKRFGGNFRDALSFVEETSEKGFILGGPSSSRIYGDKTQDNWTVQGLSKRNYWVVKIDSSGNKIWDRVYGRKEGNGSHIYGKLLKDNTFIIAGDAPTGVSGDKTVEKGGFWVFKIDAGGNIIWQKAYDGDAELKHLSLTSDGGFLLSGDSWYDTSYEPEDKSEPSGAYHQGWVIKLDSTGNKQGDKTIYTVGDDIIVGAYETLDGCFITANWTVSFGGYKSVVNWGSSDYWVVKFCETWVNSTKYPLGKGVEVSIYPNPVVSDLVISIYQQNPKEVKINLYNLMGQLVYSSNESNLNSTYTKMIDLSFLNSGYYILKIESGEEEFLKPIVKQ